MFEQLFALPALGAGQLLRRSGYPHHCQGVMVAFHVTVQPLHQSQGIGLVGLDAFAQLIPVLGPDDEVVDAQRFQRAMQAVAKRAGLVTTVN
jgi:hypothetical protein